ncbi:GatB/YqeY domain-containing protein [Alcaligenes endophyticus]|uniref:GatB/YqeY domain-containing protein n=1 Tax=Alcaligenes endophyticus TaxID=1929088 RepID=A0ABT8EK45_9BURK|nr:GatB/YqeY domain-containing protein [Alcaligenes endophyticus]MCX5591896.1 GatB/YqeY domain-containing protein [Alcaligenes endophyticus]MDN4121585.1 GatB/YqeY domain-containing protein [Alcaligenes endophyticus]
MSTSLKTRLSEDTKTAMRARDTARLGTLRLLQAAIKQVEVDKRIELSDDDIISIIEKQAKQRRESIQAFEQAGRTESAAQEKAELEVLQTYLPAQADQAEINAVLDAAIAQAQAQGAQGPAIMGKAMAQIKAQLAGRADMAAVSALLKQKIA